MYDFNFFSLLLYTFIEQNTFFPETCFTCPISEQKFTVCAGQVEREKNKLILKHVDKHFLHSCLMKERVFLEFLCVKHIKDSADS